MIAPPNVPRSAGEQARDTAGIIGSLKHEGYVPTALPGVVPLHAQGPSRVTSSVRSQMTRRSGAPYLGPQEPDNQFDRRIDLPIGFR